MLGSRIPEELEREYLVLQGDSELEESIDVYGREVRKYAYLNCDPEMIAQMLESARGSGTQHPGDFIPGIPIPVFYGVQAVYWDGNFFLRLRVLQPCGAEEIGNARRMLAVIISSWIAADGSLKPN